MRTTTAARAMRALLATALAAGCVSERVSGPDDDTCTGSALAPCDVAISDNAFTPATLRVTAGSIVRWQYETGASVHTVTADDESFESGTLSPGTGFEILFDDPGTFDYECVFHPGMTGRITVE